MKQYKYKINGADYAVDILSIQGETAQVAVNGVRFDVQMLHSELTEDALPDVALSAATSAPAAAPAPTAPADAAPTGVGEGAAVKSPLPGVVTKLHVRVGQSVKKGENLLVLEAMKMENNITAETDGTITGINVKAGESVLEGAVLLTIA